MSRKWSGCQSVASDGNLSLKSSLETALVGVHLQTRLCPYLTASFTQQVPCSVSPPTDLLVHTHKHTHGCKPVAETFIIAKIWKRVPINRKPVKLIMVPQLYDGILCWFGKMLRIITIFLKKYITVQHLCYICTHLYSYAFFFFFKKKEGSMHLEKF